MFTKIYLLTAWSVLYIIKYRLGSLYFIKKERITIKREGKNIKSKNKILEAALNEFGQKGYNNASINSICSDNNISKGLIYHYFKSKDELFLLCVKECFETLSDYLQKNVVFYNDNVEKSIQNYFMTRHKFFSENKEFRQIFYDTTLQTPKHFKKQIYDLKRNLDSVNQSFLEKIFNQLSLRESISIDNAMEYFATFQEFFNSYFQKKQSENNNSLDVMETRETQYHKILDIMLYGIAKQEDKR